MNKEVKWEREEKEREGDAYIIVGNKAMHWMQNIEKKRNSVVIWGNIICVTGFVKVAREQNYFNPS